MRRLPLLVAALAAAIALPAAAQRSLSLREVDEAIRAGQTRIAADRARFHAPYRVNVSRPPVDYVDVVTPYRRVVLAADERAQLGDRSFGQRQALELLTAADGRFDVVAEFTFHPLNTYVTMPAYEVMLMRGVAGVFPTSVERQPRFGARVDGLPPSTPVAISGTIPRGSQPMLGGTVTARFSGDAVDGTGLMDVVILEGSTELARASVDFAKLR